MVTKSTILRPTATETRADRTTAAAKTLIDEEAATRHALTKRLRLARLEREASVAKPKKSARNGKLLP